MNRRKLLPVVVIILVVAMLIAWTAGLFTAEKSHELILHGNVDIREVDMGFRQQGRIAAIAVEEGNSVRRGELIATLDPAPYKDRVAEATAAVSRAQANLTKALNGNRPQDIAQAKARVEAAQVARNYAAKDYKRRQPLVASGTISHASWDRAVATLREAEARLTEASEAFALMQAGTRPEDLAEARAQLASAQAQKAAAETDLNDTRLLAPTDGVVVTRAMEPGAIAQSGQTVMTIAISRPMRVRAYIGETDLSRISPGMKVAVTADGNNKVYSGTIGYISPRAEFTPKTVETQSLRADLVYQLRIIVTNPDDALRQGQPVTISVTDARPTGK